MIRAALYARVSTSNGQDVQNQLDQLQDVATRQGWSIAATHVEQVSGANARLKRPALDAMLTQATRREIDLVAAWSVDRLGRSLQDLIATLETLRVAGVDLYLHQQGIDTRTPAGRAMFGMLAVFAEFERSMIQERVRAGMAKAKKHGTRSGKPIGRQPLPEIKRARILALLANGAGLRETARACGVSHRVVGKVRDEMNTREWE